MVKKVLSSLLLATSLAVGTVALTAAPAQATDSWTPSCNGFWYADNHYGGWGYWNQYTGYVELTSERIMELYAIYGWECGRLSGPTSWDYAVSGYSTIYGNTTVGYRQNFACGYIVVLYGGHGDVYYDGHWHYTGGSTSTHVHVYSCVRT